MGARRHDHPILPPYGVYARRGGMDVILADVCGTRLDARAPDPEAQANARLMAAAPELLECLRDWLAAYEVRSSAAVLEMMARRTAALLAKTGGHEL